MSIKKALGLLMVIVPVLAFVIFVVYVGQGLVLLGLCVAALWFMTAAWLLFEK